MTYVFGGTLSLTQPLSNLAHLFAYRADRLCTQFSDLVFLQLISHVLVFSCPYMLTYVSVCVAIAVLQL